MTLEAQTELRPPKDARLLFIITHKQVQEKILEFTALNEVGVGKPRLSVIGVVYHNPIGGTFLSRSESKKFKIISQTCSDPLETSGNG